MKTAVLAMALLAAAPALAQNEEIIVTGSRRAGSFQAQEVQLPAITLRRAADFLVQPVHISGDTRDPDKRKAEIYAMLAAAVAQAEKRGASIQLAAGSSRLTVIDKNNYRTLPISDDGDRDDTGQVSFLIKTPLANAADFAAAEARIAAFIKSVPAAGRAELESNGDPTLSVVNPSQYRAAIIDLITADAKAATARMGDGYGVAIQGLDRQVQWGPGAPGEVALFLTYAYQIVPRSR
jgi:hypothetical protein